MSKNTSLTRNKKGGEFKARFEFDPSKNAEARLLQAFEMIFCKEGKFLPSSEVKEKAEGGALDFVN